MLFFAVINGELTSADSEEELREYAMKYAKGQHKTMSNGKSLPQRSSKTMKPASSVAGSYGKKPRIAGQK